MNPNNSSDFQNRSSPNHTRYDSLGRDTVFVGELTNNFIHPSPHQKKRDINKIQKTCGEKLQVLDSKPQKETIKEKPLIQIIRNTYETKAAGKPTQRCRSPLLNFNVESADFHEEKNEVKNNGVRKVFQEKVGFESGSVPLKGNGCSAEKSKRIEKIMDSQGMKDSLKSKEEEESYKKNGEYKDLAKAARENVKNNLNTPYKFKHSLDNKQAFYVN